MKKEREYSKSLLKEKNEEEGKQERMKHLYDEEIINAKSDHGQGQIFDETIDKGFHPMIAQVGRKTHLSHRMMHFVKFPQKGHAMQ